MFCNKLECFSWSVTSSLVYHLQANLEPTYAESLRLNS